MISVIAKLKVQEGKAADAVATFKKLIALVRNEEGTLYYTLNRDRTDPNLYVVIERYKDDAAFMAHSSTSYFAEFFAQSREFLEGSPELMMLDEIASI
jgi:quinol monooxygenase YgiN